MIPLHQFLLVGAMLFGLGAVGFLVRRNLITMFLCVEMMLQGVAINLTAFSWHHGQMHGQVLTLFIVAVAACEAGIALALILVLYRQRKSLDVSLWQDLREAGLEPVVDVEPLPPPPPEPPQPVLPAAGRLPSRQREVRRV